MSEIQGERKKASSSRRFLYGDLNRSSSVPAGEVSRLGRRQGTTLMPLAVGAVDVGGDGAVEAEVADDFIHVLACPCHKAARRAPGGIVTPWYSSWRGVGQAGQTMQTIVELIWRTIGIMIAITAGTRVSQPRDPSSGLSRQDDGNIPSVRMISRSRCAADRRLHDMNPKVNSTPLTMDEKTS